MLLTSREAKSQPVSIYFDGSDKAFRPCKSMSRVLVAAWGPDAKQYVGRSLTLYRDPTVKWGGMEVGGIRISHMTHLDSQMTMALTATKGSRKPFVVKPLATPKSEAAPIAWQDHADRLRDQLDTVTGDEARNAINHALTQPWWKVMKTENAGLAKILRDMAQVRIEGKSLDGEIIVRARG